MCLEPIYLEDHFKQTCEKAGIGEDVNIHATRHTFATIAVSSNPHDVTLKSLHAIMETSLQPQKLFFDYADFTLFFPSDTPPQQMKEDIIKILTHWKNNKCK